MEKLYKIIKNPLAYIFLLALIIRIYNLGQFPYGFHVDEVKVGWNALSILKTGHDDHGKFLSLYYDSFGDYRPTGIFYLTIPSIKIFGNTEFATRFPISLFGALTVFPIYLLAEIINKNRKILIFSLNSGHFAAILLAISPWHIELSRATNEAVVSSFFAITSLLFLIKFIQSREKRFCGMAIATLVVSYLFYHSIRLIAPLLILITGAFYFQKIKNKGSMTLFLLCLGTSILLTVLFGLGQNGLSRLNQTSIFKDLDVTYEIQRIRSENSARNILTILFDNKAVIYTKRFINEYSSYFSANFLIGPAGRPYRFATPGVGVMTYVEIVLFLIGVVQIARSKGSVLPFLLLLAAPLPAALTTEDAPNISRAFLMLPFIVIIESFGIQTISSIKKIYANKIAILTFTLFLLNSSYFFYMYFNHSVSHRPFIKNFDVDSPTYRDVGAKELSLRLDQFKGNYEKVLITNFPDNPYPWYAFFTGKNPSVFNKNYQESSNQRTYENIIFTDKKCPADDALIIYSKKNILIIDSWECPYKRQMEDGYPLKQVGSIKRPDGSEVYALLERDRTKPLYINGVYY